MAFGRRMAFDYGDVRIGVALCDPEGILASPLTTLKSSDKKLWADIGALLAEYEVVRVYVGRPAHLSGSSGQSAEKAEKFAAALSERFNVATTFIDERLTTVSATRKLREAGKSSRALKELIDMAAAVAILEQGIAMDKPK